MGPRSICLVDLRPVQHAQNIGRCNLVSYSVAGGGSTTSSIVTATCHVVSSAGNCSGSRRLSAVIPTLSATIGDWALSGPLGTLGLSCGPQFGHR